VGLLFGEEAGGEELLLGWRDEDTACGVLGASAAMDADSRTSRHVTYERHKTAEARGLRDAQTVNERRDNIIEVFEGVANKLITVSCSSVELASDSLALRLRAI
jgi:hypothetical protein